MRATGHVARGLLSRDGSCVYLADPPPSNSVASLVPLRYDITVSFGRCACSFLLSPGMILRCPPRVFPLPHAHRIALSFSVLLLRGVPEAHLEGRGIPITVEEVIEIFMVSSASRNFDATDIHWSCVIICLRSFFSCPLPLSSGESAKEREREREAAAIRQEVIFLYCTRYDKTFR